MDTNTIITITPFGVALFTGVYLYLITKKPTNG